MPDVYKYSVYQIEINSQHFPWIKKFGGPLVYQFYLYITCQNVTLFKKVANQTKKYQICYYCS
jgi:hypothetical protein